MMHPRTGEKEEEFMPRCMQYLMDNENVRDEKHAYIKCKGFWEQFHERHGDRNKKND